jgi:ribosomal protein L14E/L6E/L27E
MVKASGVADDPQTTEMVMAQAAEEVANANAAMGIAQSPEQQMLLLEKERLEFDKQKAEMAAAKDSADIALKQMDMDLKAKENMNDLVLNVGKMEADERKENLKALEAAARLEIEKQRVDDDTELKAANTAMQTLQSIGKRIRGNDE